MKTMTGIGLRTYLEIVKVEAPSEASYGDTVNVNIYVRNKWTYRIFAIVTGNCDGDKLSSSSHWIWPDAQRIFGFSFTMPNKSVDLWIWAFYWTEAGWPEEPDDEYGPVKISLVGVPPPEWEFLASEPFTISPGVVPAEWELLDSEPFTIEPGLVPAEWEFLASEPFTIEPGVAPPPPPPPPIAGIPTWLIAAGAIGGAAAIGALIYLSRPAPAKKKPEKKKE